MDKFDYTKSMSLDMEKWDILGFKPKKDISFQGFGIFASFLGHDLDLKFIIKSDRKEYKE